MIVWGGWDGADLDTGGRFDPVTNQWTLNNLEKMMRDLFYFEVAIKMVGAATYNMKTINPVDYCFNCLDLKMVVLSKECDEFKLLK